MAIFKWRLIFSLLWLGFIPAHASDVEVIEEIQARYIKALDNMEDVFDESVKRIEKQAGVRIKLRKEQVRNSLLILEINDLQFEKEEWDRRLKELTGSDDPKRIFLSRILCPISSIFGSEGKVVREIYKVQDKIDSAQKKLEESNKKIRFLLIHIDELDATIERIHQRYIAILAELDSLRKQL